MKETLRGFAARAVVASGLARLGRRFGDRAGTMILYGHRVADDDEAFFQGLPPRWFADQLAYLTRHYEVIPLATLTACITEQRAPPPASVVLTFDDGFRDNYEEAWPILERFGVTATFFVVTESLTDGRLPWSQRLGYVFQRTDRQEVSHPMFGAEPVTLAGEQQRRHVYARAMAALAPLPRTERDARIEALAASLGVEPPRDRMMTWAHARTMLDAGQEIGAHTYSHALLAAVHPDEARWEMERSKSDVGERLGIERPAFCFPAGSTSPTLRGLAREIGFASCFVPNRRQRINRPGSVDPFSLVRVGLPNRPAVELEAELDGPFHSMRRMAGRYRRGGDR